MVVLQMEVCLLLQLVLIRSAHISTSMLSVRALGHGRSRGQGRGTGECSAFVVVCSASTAEISCSSCRGSERLVLLVVVVLPTQASMLILLDSWSSF